MMVSFPTRANTKTLIILTKGTPPKFESALALDKIKRPGPFGIGMANI